MTFLLEKARRTDMKNACQYAFIMLPAVLKECPAFYNAVGYISNHDDSQIPNKSKMHTNTTAAALRNFVISVSEGGIKKCNTVLFGRHIQTFQSNV
jgi:hypothetical protein